MVSSVPVPEIMQRRWKRLAVQPFGPLAQPPHCCLSQAAIPRHHCRTREGLLKIASAQLFRHPRHPRHRSGNTCFGPKDVARKKAMMFPVGLSKFDDLFQRRADIGHRIGPCWPRETFRGILLRQQQHRVVRRRWPSRAVLARRTPSPCPHRGQICGAVETIAMPRSD